MKRSINSSLEEYNEIDQQYNQAVRDYNNERSMKELQRSKFFEANFEAQKSVSNYIRSLLQPVVSSDFLNSLIIETSLDNYKDLGIRGAIVVKYTKKDSALSWDWTFRVGYSNRNDSNAVRSTNSWSGMNATTAEDISVLKQSVAVLERLLTVSDDEIIEVMQENVVYEDDYVTQKVQHLNEKEFKLRKLEALVGTGQYIKIKNQEYLQLESSTAKQFRVRVASVYEPEYFNGNYYNYPAQVRIIDTRRYSKDRILDIVPDKFELFSEEDLKEMAEEYNRKFNELHNGVK